MNNRTPKFKGNSTDLEGDIFDCSDYKQAEKYVSTIKRIAEYVRAEYKYGSDIRSTLENEARITIPHPVTHNTDPMPLLYSIIFDKDIDIYMKRRSTLYKNVQKCYSLILGQCTDLLKSKLKQSHEWRASLTTYDVLILIRIIRTITLKFDEQTYLKFALHQAKADFYNIRLPCLML